MGKRKKDPVEIADELNQTGELPDENEAPKPPKWVRFDELKPMVSELIEMYPDKLSHIRPSSVGYAAFSKKRSDAAAKVFPMRPMYGLFANVDYIVAVHIESWVLKTVSEKYVLVFHELLHIPTEGFDENSADFRKTIKHDVQDFAFVLETFGIHWENSEKILKKRKATDEPKTEVKAEAKDEDAEVQETIDVREDEEADIEDGNVEEE